MHSRASHVGGFLAFLLVALALPRCAAGEVRLPAVIASNMILQREVRLPIWGWASPGERVTVAIAGQSAVSTAGPDGRWRVNLAPLPAGGPHTMTVSGSNEIVLDNVLVGEVWVASGQSNMDWPVRWSRDADEEIAAANYPQIRLFTVAKATADSPQPDCKGSWVECSPATVEWFSAVAYFFGRELHGVLGVPIGLINTSWGGTPAESWTSAATLRMDAEYRPIIERWEQVMAAYPAALRDYERRALPAWERAVAKAKAEGTEPPARPGPPVGPGNPWQPSALYNAMIAPLVPYAVRGAIWYQGESNADRAYQYRRLFPDMIRDWRRAWGQGDFPFLFVQLANFMPVESEPTATPWAELREAQLMTLRLPNTGMAVAIDIGEAEDIHPRNKQDVGRRLALAAKSIAYGMPVEWSGPMLESMRVEGSRVRLFLSHRAGGLATLDGSQPKGFAIAGADRKFVWADAAIEGDTVVVWSDQVPEPVAVRYAWANNPVCNLCNAAGLPASPFRTDDWPGVTQGRR